MKAKLMMKISIIFLFISIIVNIPNKVSANENENFIYEIENNEIIITGIKNKNITNIVIPEQIDGKDVIKIGNDVFYECINLTEIQITNKIISIGDRAFNGCKKLKRIKIPSKTREIGLGAFADCENLEEVELPNGLISIGYYAFTRCSNLKTINIPDSVTTLVAGVFENCTSIDNVVVSKNVKELNATFSGCTNLKSIILKDGLTKISTAFYNCTSLENIILPESLAYIEDRAFYNCASLKDINIPSSVINIGFSAFDKCSNLTKIELSNKTESIGTQVFSNCTKLEKVVLSNYITKIPEKAFYNCTNLKEILLPNRIQKIENLAFYNCKNIERLKILKSVLEISISAFDGCDNLTLEVENNSKAYELVKDNNLKFKLLLINISKCNFENIGSQTYNGEAIKPNIIIKEDNVILQNNRDYIISYIDNIKTGKATIIITGKGNYTGTKTISFNIIPSQVTNLKVKSQKEKEITLQWSKNGGNVTGYKLYKYNSITKKYDYVGKTTNTSYTIKKLTVGTTYKFRVKAYKTIDNKVYEGKQSELSASTQPAITKITKLATKNKRVTIKWNKVSKATGYEIYMSTSKNKGYSKIKNITKKSTITYKKGSLKKNKTYYFKIRTYRTVNGKKVYSSYSNIKSIKVK